MLPRTVKGKEATFTVITMTVDAQLREKDMEGIWDNLHTSSPQSNILKRKPSKKPLKNCDKDTEV